MRFEDALKAMREGKKVRLTDWIPNGYIAIEDNEIHNYFPTLCEQTLDMDEIMSNKWEIIE